MYSSPNTVLYSPYTQNLHMKDKIQRCITTGSLYMMEQWTVQILKRNCTSQHRDKWGKHKILCSMLQVVTSEKGGSYAVDGNKQH